MFFLSQHLDFWLCCWLFLVLQDTNYEGKYRLCFTGVFLPGIFIQESVEYPFPFTVVYKLVQHDFLPGSSHSSDCTDPQQGGGGKCFGNGSQHRAQLHNCTEEKGVVFFLVWFVFPSHILLPTEKMLLESWMEKTSAPFIPVGAWNVLKCSTCFMAVAFPLSGLTSTGRCQKTLHSQPTQGPLVSNFFLMSLHSPGLKLKLVWPLCLQGIFLKGC